MQRSLSGKVIARIRNGGIRCGDLIEASGSLAQDRLLNGTAMLAATKFPTMVNLLTYSLRSDDASGKAVGAGFPR